jgi:hypothetical protein
MKNSRQTEECAKLEYGGEVIQLHDGFATIEHHHQGFRKPTGYLTSHDACQRVIDGLSAKECAEYHRILKEMCESDIERFLKATYAQKVEAILKAKGVWTSEEDGLIESEEYLNEEG